MSRGAEVRVLTGKSLRLTGITNRWGCQEVVGVWSMFSGMGTPLPVLLGTLYEMRLMPAWLDMFSVARADGYSPWRFFAVLEEALELSGYPEDVANWVLGVLEPVRPKPRGEHDAERD